jgi:hypothetical protein
MHPTIRRDESIDEDRTAEQTRTVGHVSHDAQLRVDRRVKTILDRREGAVGRARLAARRLSEGRPLRDNADQVAPPTSP